ncbi:MAG: glycosyltransferase [Proteobacteria bacterium]|nr:glycosyltransferase [Pseudomonadota bacterium]
MRVMIVGGNQMKYFASRYYNYANKLANGFIRNNHTVVRFFDRDISRLSNIFRSRKMGVGSANERLLDQVSDFEPDLILFVHADVIRPVTLEHLKGRFPGVKLAQVGVDSLFMPGNVQRLNTKSPHVDATFLTTAGEGLKKISGGRPAYYIPNIVDSGMETGQAFDADCDIDLVFVCGSFDAEGGDPRLATLDVIRERLPDIRFPYHVDHETGGLWGANYMRTLGRSKCGLNLSRQREGPINIGKAEDLYIYSSDRVSQLTGNGVLTLTHEQFYLDQLFSEDEMIFFSSNDDLVDKIAYFLDNDGERRRIAKNGWKKAHEELNERLAAQYIIDIMFREKLSHPYIWPTEKVVSPG